MCHLLPISVTFCEYHMKTEYVTIDNSIGNEVLSWETSPIPSHTDLVGGGQSLTQADKIFLLVFRRELEPQVRNQP